MNWRNNRVFISAVFYLSLTIMVIIGIFSIITTRDLIQYNQLLNQSLRVNGVLNKVRGFVMGVESSERGYLLTGNDLFLVSYREGVGDLPFQLAVIRSLTRSRPRSQQLIDDLEPLINRKFALMRQRISWLGRGNQDAAVRSVKSKVELGLVRKINFVLDALGQEERRVLSERQARVESMRRRATWVRIIGAPLSFGLLILVFVCLTREIRGRRRTAADLRLCEERLRVFMEHSPAISFMKDETGRYVHVNGLIEQFSTCKPVELVGKTDNELWPLEVAQHLQAVDRVVFSEDKPMEIMATLPDRNDTLRDYLIYEFPIPGHQGQRVLGGVAVDITQRKKTEEAFQQAARELRLVVNNIPAVVFKGYLDGTVDFFDDRVEELTGYARKEFESRQRRWPDLILPQDLTTSRERLIKALKGSGLYVREYRISTKTGEMIWIQERGSIVRQADGAVDYISGVFFDITARKRGEEALAESEKRYRNIFDNAVEGIFQSTPEGPFINVNPAMAEMYGYASPAELLDAIKDIKHQVYVEPERRRDFQRLIAQDGFVKNFEYEVYRKDRSTLWISKNARAVCDQTGNLLYYEGFAENITARKCTERKLQRANRTLKTLTAVHHALVDATVEYTFLQDICRIITEVGGYRLAWVALAHHDDSKLVSPLAYAGIEAGYLEGLNISWADNEKGRGPTGTAIRTNKTTIVKDVLSDPNFASRREKILSHGLASAISLPLPLDGEPWCALTIYALEVNAFDEEEVTLLEELAQDIHYGIISLRAQKARQRAEAALRESEEKFRGLFETSPDVVVQLDLNFNFLMVNQMAEPLFGYERATQLIGKKFLDVVDPVDHPRVLENSRRLLENGSMRNVEFTFLKQDGSSFLGEVSAALTVDSAGTPKAYAGTIRDITERKRMQDNLEVERLRLFALLDGLPVYVYLRAPDHSFRFVNRIFREHFGDPENRPCYAVLHGRDKPCEFCPAMRVLENGLPQEWEWTAANGRTYHLHDYPFTDVDGSSLVLEIGMDITARKQAEESLKESYERLQASLEGTVTALSALVESKDPYTAGHQRRVTSLACALAREMGLPEEQIEGIRVMGYLHDIGKIAVPAEILSRPGNINEYEFNLIKQHPQSGFDILRQISFPWPVAQAVFQHHERLDGSGYPQGLSGDKIILEARVLAVADVVEAMSSHRPYRPALGVKLALEEIARNKEVLYDPEVVEACIRLFEDRGYEIT
jgi:PAS domain S-box-containing protein/putative nucleotidyltransferase with HDIG domain